MTRRSLSGRGRPRTGFEFQQFHLVPYLTVLDLHDSRVSEAAVRQLMQLPELRELDISNTPTTAAGVAELRRDWPDCHITRLDD